jgi:hypothetical protein
MSIAFAMVNSRQRQKSAAKQKSWISVGGEVCPVRSNRCTDFLKDYYAVKTVNNFFRKILCKIKEL